MEIEVYNRSRGKRKDNGVWVYGYYAPYSINPIYKDCFIHTEDGECFEVHPETVCGSTGLNDINDKEAYSGDIYIDNHGIKRTIWRSKGGFRSESNPVSFGYGSQDGINPAIALSDPQTTSWFEGNCEIIGNIYDSHEIITNK